nr:acetyl-CoA carboxylase 1 [Tanacetum cinerariifolium]
MSKNGFDESEIIRVLAGKLTTVAAMAVILLMLWRQFSSRSVRQEMKKLYTGRVFAFGESKTLAVANMVLGLKEIQIHGEIRTNVDYTIDLLHVDSRIAMRIRAERPLWYLSVVGCAIYVTVSGSTAMVSDCWLSQKGQIPPYVLFGRFVPRIFVSFTRPWFSNDYHSDTVQTGQIQNTCTRPPVLKETEIIVTFICVRVLYMIGGDVMDYCDEGIRRLSLSSYLEFGNLDLQQAGVGVLSSYSTGQKRKRSESLQPRRTRRVVCRRLMTHGMPAGPAALEVKVRNILSNWSRRLEEKHSQQKATTQFLADAKSQVWTESKIMRKSWLNVHYIDLLTISLEIAEVVIRYCLHHNCYAICVVAFGDMMPPLELRNALVVIRWSTNYLLWSVRCSGRIVVQLKTTTKDHDCWEKPMHMDTYRTIHTVHAPSGTHTERKLHQMMLEDRKFKRNSCLSFMEMPKPDVNVVSRKIKGKTADHKDTDEYEPLENKVVPLFAFDNTHRLILTHQKLLPQIPRILIPPPSHIIPIPIKMVSVGGCVVLGWNDARSGRMVESENHLPRYWDGRRVLHNQICATSPTRMRSYITYAKTLLEKLDIPKSINLLSRLCEVCHTTPRHPHLHRSTPPRIHSSSSSPLVTTPGDSRPVAATNPDHHYHLAAITTYTITPSPPPPHAATPPVAITTIFMQNKGCLGSSQQTEKGVLGVGLPVMVRLDMSSGI